MDRRQKSARIRFYSGEVGFDRYTLAYAMGVSQQCTWYWWRARRSPSDRMTQRFCTVVGISLARFYGPLPSSRPKRTAPFERRMVLA